MKVVLENVTKTFYDKKTKKETIAVNNISLELPDGKLIGLLGPSGCGKSTTLYMLSGLQIPTSGKIYFGENDVTKLPADKREIGLVFQNYALYPHFTVLENITFPLLNMKYKKADAIAKATEVAKLVQIEDYLDRHPKELSGGQQQRVAIARALVKNPDVLLLDEPLSNLDARLRLQTREEIKRIQQASKVTTVFVTHDQEEAMSISDVMIVMKNGVIQQVDAPQDMFDNPKNLFVAEFLGTPPINTFNGTVENGKLYIGEEAIMDVNLEDKEVFVSIRPEGFILSDNGVFTAGVNRVELLGKELSVIGTNPNATKDTIKITLNTDEGIDFKSEMKFNIKQNKLFVFDKETQERIFI